MAYVQAILFKKPYFTLEEEKEWLKEHNYKPIKDVHETDNFDRWRLHQPNQDKYRYRTLHLGKNIDAIVGYLRRKSI